jgi:hypothetical protein
MHVDALCGAKNFAVETGDAMLDKFEDRDQLAPSLFHVDNVGGANGITKSAAGALFQVDINDHVSLAT